MSAALAVATMAGFYTLVYLGGKPSVPTGPRIAVIPFEDLTGNPDDPRAPFRARGMPVELIEGLMEGLRKAGLNVEPLE